MTTRMSMLDAAMFGALVLGQGWPLYAQDVNTMFTVSVLDGAIEQAFVRELGSPLPTGCSSATLPLPPGQTPDDVNPDFPTPRDLPTHGLPSHPGAKGYVRLFYECKNATAYVYQKFGEASLAAARASSHAPTPTMSVREPVRVSADAALPTPSLTTCQLQLCQNGTYRKTSNWLTCPQCQ